MTAQPTTKTPIPEFATIEEEAQWWDTHDLADYWDEFTPVEVTFAKNLSSPLAAALTIRLDAVTLAELRARACAEGIAASALARTWIAERLQAAAPAVTALPGRRTAAATAAGARARPAP